MLGGGEVGREPRTADQLGGRIGRAQFGVLILERLQPAQQFVELAVGDDRRVTHVVAELMFANLVSEFLPLPAQVGVDGIGFGVGVCRAHPGRLSKRTDMRAGARDRRRSVKL